MRRKAGGAERQKQLGKVKIEVWLSEAQMKAFEKLCGELGMKKSTVARRLLNSAVGGGAKYCRYVENNMYD